MHLGEFSNDPDQRCTNTPTKFNVAVCLEACTANNTKLQARMLQLKQKKPTNDVVQPEIVNISQPTTKQCTTLGWAPQDAAGVPGEWQSGKASQPRPESFLSFAKVSVMTLLVTCPSCNSLNSLWLDVEERPAAIYQVNHPECPSDCKRTYVNSSSEGVIVAAGVGVPSTTKPKVCM